MLAECSEYSLAGCLKRLRVLSPLVCREEEVLFSSLFKPFEAIRLAFSGEGVPALHSMMPQAQVRDMGEFGASEAVDTLSSFEVIHERGLFLRSECPQQTNKCGVRAF